MAEVPGRWEADPLFSAAEIVQDSADRMESVYRLLLHEETLLQGDASDSKLHTSMQFHRRDLVTTLETTKWQLEDFEKAVQLASLSDQSNLKVKSLSSFKQFIQAIREHISQVERSLQNLPSENRDRDPQITSLNDHEVDGLAQFLYGGNSTVHQLHGPDSNLASRDATDADYDEIVEVESKDVKNLQSINGKYLNHHDANVGLHHPKASVFSTRSSDFHHVCLGETEEISSGNPEPCDLETGACNTKHFIAKSNLRGSVLGSLRTFWFASTNKLTRSFTKRRKDGDASYEYISDNGWLQSSVPSVSPAAQFFVRINALWRPLNNIQYTLLSVRIRLSTLMAVTLIVIGLLSFWIVW